jgi:hypothetical protein
MSAFLKKVLLAITIFLPSLVDFTDFKGILQDNFPESDEIMGCHFYVSACSLKDVAN